MRRFRWADQEKANQEKTKEGTILKCSVRYNVKKENNCMNHMADTLSEGL